LRAPATFSPRWVIAMTDETLIRRGRGLAQVQRQPDGKPTFVSDMLDDLANGLEAARADLEKLKDPAAVHLNMLKGTIAKISMMQCAHIHGMAEMERWNRMLRLEAENEKLREAVGQALDDMGKDGLCVCPACKDLLKEAAAISADHKEQQA
jgi:hypothetical protein